MIKYKFSRALFGFIVLWCGMLPAVSQPVIEKGKFSGDFGFSGMYYLPDSLIGAEEVKSKVRGNAFLNLNYSIGGLSVGTRYEFYLFPLIDMEKIDYKGQGFTYYYADYKNSFIQVTAGTFYEQFGSGLALRAYEERELGVDNSLLGGRVRITPYKGIYLKGVWGIERENFDFDYANRHDYIRGLDGEIVFGELCPKIAEKGFALNIGASLVSKYEKSETDYYFSLYPGSDSATQAYIPNNNIPANVSIWATRLQFGYKGFRVETEYARKNNDPNLGNNYIYKSGEALFLSATYAMKGLGVSASFVRADNMEFRSTRQANRQTSLLMINYIPAINRQYSYPLIGNYSYSVQPNGQIGTQLQINYQIPKKSKLGGKYGTDIAFNYARMHDIRQDILPLALENGTQTGTNGYQSSFFAFGKNLLYQDVGIEISRRFTKCWKLILAYNYLTYDLFRLQGHGEMVYAHHVAADLTCKINARHALRLELQHLTTQQDLGNWVAATLEYAINPHWILSVGDQWNYGNPEPEKRIHYYNVAAAFVTGSTRVGLNFGKTREGLLCIGGVCRTVPASYGCGLTVTTSF